MNKNLELKLSKEEFILKGNSSSIVTIIIMSYIFSAIKFLIN
jgi:hypothetical protein